MVKKDKEKTKNLQERHKSRTVKQLPKSENSKHKQKCMGMDGWSNSSQKQGEGLNGKDHRLPSGVNIFLSR